MVETLEKKLNQEYLEYNSPEKISSDYGFDLYEIFRNFYNAKSIFYSQKKDFDEYIRKIKEQKSISNGNKLEPIDIMEAVEATIDFAKVMEDYLFPLKEKSHKLFRNEQEKTRDSFDLNVSTIYHRAALVKEKEYELENYGPQFKASNLLAEYAKILEDITDIPEKLLEIDNLFSISEERLEEILKLPENNQNKTIIRSIYLNSNLSEIYSGGIERLYERIYNNGPAEGYLTVAKSFYDSGFIHEAADAIKCGFESVDKMRERADENSLKLESELKILDVAVQLRNGSK